MDNIHRYKIPMPILRKFNRISVYPRRYFTKGGQDPSGTHHTRRRPPETKINIIICHHSKYKSTWLLILFNSIIVIMPKKSCQLFHFFLFFGLALLGTCRSRTVLSVVETQREFVFKHLESDITI